VGPAAKWSISTIVAHGECLSKTIFEEKKKKKGNKEIWSRSQKKNVGERTAVKNMKRAPGQKKVPGDGADRKKEDKTKERGVGKRGKRRGVEIVARRPE